MEKIIPTITDYPANPPSAEAIDKAFSDALARLIEQCGLQHVLILWEAQPVQNNRNYGSLGCGSVAARIGIATEYLWQQKNYTNMSD
jgi:hypothetical protein